MVCKSPSELEINVYDNFSRNMTNWDYLAQWAIMSSTNNMIHNRNCEFLHSLPGEMEISYSRDSCMEDDDKTLFESNFLNRVNVSDLPPHQLAIKVGTCIILIKNLDIYNGHCNGTRYIILEITNNLMKAERLIGGTKSIILIPIIPMISKDSSFPVPFKQVQFPVPLA